jgi:dephospho-CoA kinase
MLKVGLTGGIGSGKSMVSDLLKIMGYPVYNSDYEAKRLCIDSESLKSKLQQAFGNSLYNEGMLNKIAFAAIIFANPIKLKEANEIIHPFVTNDFLEWAKKQPATLVFIESAILLESEVQQHLDKTITVSASEEIRIERVIKRDNIEQKLVVARIKNQLSETERLQKADYIIYNDHKQALIPQLEKVLSLLQ